MTDVEKAYRTYDRAKLMLRVTAVVMLMAALGLLLRGDIRAEATRDDIARSVDLLLECTTPPEERVPPVKVDAEANDCYARGLRQQGNAVETISGVSIVAAACGAAHPGDVTATRRCVEEALDQ